MSGERSEQLALWGLKELMRDLLVNASHFHCQR